MPGTVLEAGSTSGNKQKALPSATCVLAGKDRS